MAGTVAKVAMQIAGNLGFVNFGHDEVLNVLHYFHTTVHSQIAISSWNFPENISYSDDRTPITIIPWDEYGRKLNKQHFVDYSLKLDEKLEKEKGWEFNRYKTWTDAHVRWEKDTHAGLTIDVDLKHTVEGGYNDEKWHYWGWPDDRGTVASWITWALDADGPACLATLGKSNAIGEKISNLTSEGWTGEWAKTCGYPWYPSDVDVDGIRPTCMWFGKDPESVMFQGMAIRLEAFTADKYYYEHIEDYCKKMDIIPTSIDSAKFKVWGDINEFIGGNHTFDALPTPADERANHPEKLRKEPYKYYNGTVYHDQGSKNASRWDRRQFSSTLVKSRVDPNTTESHSAKVVCGSTSSYGPDFFNSVEGLLCEMSQKKIYGLCDVTSKEKKRCFDEPANALYSRHGLYVYPDPRGGSQFQQPKAYDNSKIIQWG